MPRPWLPLPAATLLLAAGVRSVKVAMRHRTMMMTAAVQAADALLSAFFSGTGAVMGAVLTTGLLVVLSGVQAPPRHVAPDAHVDRHAEQRQQPEHQHRVERMIHEQMDGD